MNTCPVCGYKELKRPAYEVNGAGSDQICPCCRFQFGLSDFPYEERDRLMTQWRERWIQNGCEWSSHSKPPENWNPQVQLDDLK